MKVEMQMDLEPIRVPNFVFVRQLTDMGVEEGHGSIDIASLSDAVLIQLAQQFQSHLLEHARTRRLSKTKVA